MDKEAYENYVEAIRTNLNHPGGFDRSVIRQNLLRIMDLVETDSKISVYRGDTIDALTKENDALREELKLVMNIRKAAGDTLKDYISQYSEKEQEIEDLKNELAQARSVLIQENDLLRDKVRNLEANQRLLIENHPIVVALNKEINDLNEQLEAVKQAHHSSEMQLIKKNSELVYAINNIYNEAGEALYKLTNAHSN